MPRHTAPALALALLLPAAALAQGTVYYPAEPVPGYPADLPPGTPPPPAAPAPLEQPAQTEPAEAYGVAVDEDPAGDVSLSTFEAPLGSYGQWTEVEGYGRVWRPRVPPGWRPYYYGRWEWTTEGWLWVSDEPFGWATYHYGRWTWARGMGWLWVPGYQWAPAWVSWRYGGDAVGWAPLAPGLSLYVTNFAFVDFWWTFVPSARFCGVPVWGAAFAPGHARRWFDATRPAPPRGGFRGDPLRPGRPGLPGWGGPAPRLIEERMGRPLRPARIVTSPVPGGGRSRPGEIGVYRPEARPRPSAGRGAWEGGPPRSGGQLPPARPPAAAPRPERPAAPAPAPQRLDRGSGGGERFLPRKEPAARPAQPRLAPAPAPRPERAQPEPARGGEGHGGGEGQRRDGNHHRRE